MMNKTLKNIIYLLVVFGWLIIKPFSPSTEAVLNFYKSANVPQNLKLFILTLSSGSIFLILIGAFILFVLAIRQLYLMKKGRGDLKTLRPWVGGVFFIFDLMLLIELVIIRMHS